MVNISDLPSLVGKQISTSVLEAALCRALPTPACCTCTFRDIYQPTLQTTSRCRHASTYATESALHTCS